MDGLFGGQGGGMDGLFGDPAKLALMLQLLSSKKGGNPGAPLMQYAAFQEQQKQSAQQQEMQRMQMEQMKQAQAKQQQLDALAPKFMRGNASEAGPQVPGMDWRGYSQAVAGVDPMRGLDLQSKLGQMNSKDLHKLGEGDVLVDSTGNKVASGNAKREGPQVGTLQTIMQGDKEFQYRWDGKEWKIAGSGPRFKPNEPEKSPQPHIYDGPTGPMWVTPPQRGSTSGTMPVTGPDGQPIGAKKRDQPLTEVQGNATAYAMRAAHADKLLREIESEGHNPAAFPGIQNRMAGGPLNVLSTDAAQRYNATKQNFVTAVLRKESGAAISQTEFDKEDQKYFPQSGDGAKVRADKQRARELAIKALEIQAGPGMKQQAQPGGWSIKPLE